MGITYEEINFEKLIQDLSSCCLDDNICHSCSSTDCIIAYAQTCLTFCLRKKISYVEQDASSIPSLDIKLYDEIPFARGIAHILRTCRSCESEHFDQCVISIIRNCYEIGLFGEVQPYTGSNFRYLNTIHNKNPHLALDIIQEFHKL